MPPLLQVSPCPVAKIAVLALVCSLIGGKAHAQSNGAENGEQATSNPLLPASYSEWLQPYQHKTLKDTFNAVATGVRFEPYSGVRRGAVGTAIAQSGNALDQSVLLAHQLRMLGYNLRFVEGTLESANRMALMHSVFPPNIAEASFPIPSEDRYDPIEDAKLQSLLAKHYWLQVSLNGQWVSLDPSFPRAVVGEAYAAVERSWTELPADFYQTVAISHNITGKNGKSQALGSVEMRTAELGIAPIQILITGVPEFEAHEKPSRNTLGALGGALTGAKPKTESEQTPAKQIATRYSTRLNWLDQATSFNDFRIPTRAGVALVADTQQSNIEQEDLVEPIEDEWLEFTIHSTGTEPRSVKRWLHRSTGEFDRPESYRQYTVSVFAHQIPTNLTDALFKRANAVAWEARAQQTQSDVELAELAQFNHAISASVGLLTTVSVASLADELSDSAAFSKGLATVYATPRIYLYNVVGDIENNELRESTSIDLRLDEIETYPFPGYAKSVSYWFQLGRGLRQSALERTVLDKLFSFDKAVSTSLLMQESQAQGTPLLAITNANQDQYKTNAAFQRVDERFVKEALDTGKTIILPDTPVQLNGVSRVGWWEMDNESGRVIGVMESGEHQALVESWLGRENNPSREGVAYVFGMFTGANATHMLLLGKLLSKGRLTENDIQHIEKVLENIACLSCPSASVGFEATLSTDCFAIKREFAKGKELPFCDSYGKGFKCAVSAIIGNIRKENLFEEAELTVSGPIIIQGLCN